MKNESKSVTNILIFCLRSWSQIMVFINMMKFLAILLQVKVDQNFD